MGTGSAWLKHDNKPMAKNSFNPDLDALALKVFPIHALPPEVLNRQVRRIIRHRLKTPKGRRFRRIAKLLDLDLGMPL